LAVIVFGEMRRSIITIIVLGLIACGRTGKSIEVGLRGIDYNVLGYEDFVQKLNRNWQVPFGNGYQSYDLSKSEISRCEELVKKTIEGYNKNPVLGTVDLEKYGRQYVAAKSPSGQVIVYINCFCNPDKFPDRDKYEVRASDGGSCYFQFIINLTEEEILNFEMNGVA
jgi:hypothetical protein